MAQCKLCGTRYWFFSNHICKPQQVTKKNYTYPNTPFKISIQSRLFDVIPIQVLQMTFNSNKCMLNNYFNNKHF